MLAALVFVARPSIAEAQLEAAPPKRASSVLSANELFAKFQPAVVKVGRSEPLVTVPCCDRAYRIKAWSTKGPLIERVREGGR